MNGWVTIQVFLKVFLIFLSQCYVRHLQVKKKYSNIEQDFKKQKQELDDRESHHINPPFPPFLRLIAHQTAALALIE